MPLVVFVIVGLSSLHLSFHICTLGMTVLSWIPGLLWGSGGRKLCADSKTQQRHRIIVISVSISVLLLGFQRAFSSLLLLNVQQLCKVGRADDRTLIYRCLRLFVMDREARRAAIHGVAKSRTRLSDWTELNWRLLEGFPGGASVKESACQCRRHKRYEFDPWVGEIPWRRAWQPTPVFLPGESHRQRYLVGLHGVTKTWTGLKQLGMHTHSHDIYKMVRTIIVSRVISIGYFKSRSTNVQHLPQVFIFVNLWRYLLCLPC